MLNTKYVHVLLDCNILLSFFFLKRLLDWYKSGTCMTNGSALKLMFTEAQLRVPRPSQSHELLASGGLRGSGKPGCQRRGHFTRNSDGCDGCDAPPTTPPRQATAAAPARGSSIGFKSITAMSFSPAWPTL